MRESAALHVLGVCTHRIGLADEAPRSELVDWKLRSSTEPGTARAPCSHGSAATSP